MGSVRAGLWVRGRDEEGVRPGNPPPLPRRMATSDAMARFWMYVGQLA